MKWIELLKAVGEYPAGKFVEVEDHIARSYVEGGLAKDGGDGPEVVQLQRATAAFRQELQGVTTEFAKVFGEATESIRKRPIIRSGSGAEFGTIEGTESPEDRQAGWGDIVRSIVDASDPNGEPDDKAKARTKLTKLYGFAPAGGANWAAGDREANRHAERKFARSNPNAYAAIKRNMVESSGAAGGYLTAVTYESMIIEVAAEEEVFANRCTKVPLGTRQTEWPALDQYAAPAAGQAAWFGGVKVYRKGESSQRTESDPKFKKVVLLANDLTGYTEISRDEMQDSVAALDAKVPMLLGGAIGWRTDWEVMNGNGTGMFFGITNSPCVINVSRNTSSHIKYQDVFAMYTRMLPSERASAAWFIHPFAMVDVFSMVDGTGRLIYLPNLTTPAEGGTISQRPSGYLMGIPVIETEKVPQLGSTGDLSLFSMKRYLLGTRSGLEVGISEHFKWDTDQIAIRVKTRNDGKPQLVNSIYLSDGSGSNKVSAFVQLAA